MKYMFSTQIPGFILDDGAGTAALTTTLEFKYPTLRVLAVNISPAMLKTFREELLPNTETLVIDASDLNDLLGTRSFSHVRRSRPHCPSRQTLFDRANAPISR